MSEQTLTNPMHFAYIPSPLAIDKRPELSIFPLNVMYVSLANIDGVDSSGTSLYEPYFASYRKNKRTQRMRYYNIYSKADYIDITYFIDKCEYIGVKYVNDTEIFTTYGKSWKTFFIHLTLGGLTNNEVCKFEPIELA